MKLLIKLEDLDKYKSRDKIPLECEYCHKTFYMPKNQVQCVIKGKSHSIGKLCSKECSNRFNDKRIITKCKQCNNEIKVKQRESKKCKNNFCSNKCSGLYNGFKIRTGTNRSKLEKWLEIKLKELYPNLQIKYNTREIIRGELDIYIPILNIAFELNGIFHYEDIFGKLEETKNNDKRKYSECIEKRIGLCVIDTSKQKYFKEKTSYEFLKIITNIIDKRLEESTRVQLDAN